MLLQKVVEISETCEKLSDAKEKWLELEEQIPVMDVWERLQARSWILAEKVCVSGSTPGSFRKADGKAT